MDKIVLIKRLQILYEIHHKLYLMVKRKKKKELNVMQQLIFYDLLKSSNFDQNSKIMVFQNDQQNFAQNRFSLVIIYRCVQI